MSFTNEIKCVFWSIADVYLKWNAQNWIVSLAKLEASIHCVELENHKLLCNAHSSVHWTRKR